MSIIPKFRFKKKQPARVKSPKNVSVQDMIQQELQSYISQEDLKGYIQKIERDKEKRRIWNSLSNRKKLQLLRYLVSKREESRDAKKQRFQR